MYEHMLISTFAVSFVQHVMFLFRQRVTLRSILTVHQVRMIPIILLPFSAPGAMSFVIRLAKYELCKNSKCKSCSFHSYAHVRMQPCIVSARVQ